MLSANALWTRRRRPDEPKGSSGFHACSNSKPSWNAIRNSLKTRHPTDTWPGSWTTSTGRGGPVMRNVCSGTTDTRALYRDRKNKRENNNMSMNLTKLTNAEYPLSDAREAIDGDNALDPSDPSAYYTAGLLDRQGSRTRRRQGRHHRIQQNRPGAHQRTAQPIQRPIPRRRQTKRGGQRGGARRRMGPDHTPAEKHQHPLGVRRQGNQGWYRRVHAQCRGNDHRLFRKRVRDHPRGTGRRRQRPRGRRGRIRVRPLR